MNPTTGKIERLSGITDDGLPVFESYGLQLLFTPLAIQKATESGFYVEAHMQTNHCGQKRPYVAMLVGNVHIQSGWLFGDRK